MSQPVDDTRFPDPVYARTVLEPLFEHMKARFSGPLDAINRAHCVMLAETGILPMEEASKIARALQELEAARDLGAMRYDGSVEDLFFAVEAELKAAIGIDLAGRLHTGRSRNDMDHTMYRMRLKTVIETLMEEARALAAALLAVAEVNAGTIIVAYTHGQPAQPTTFGHYLSAALEVLLRDCARMEAALDVVDRCPMGAAAITTTGFPLDRHRMAALLGFSAPTLNSYGSIASVDYVTGAYAALDLMMLHLGRLVQDFQVWSSFEVGQLYVANSMVQISSIMPQKRNPVPIEHLRLLSSLASGQAATVVRTMHNTPFTDMNDSEGEVQAAGFRAFETAGRVLDLLCALVPLVSVRSERVAETIDRSCITITELADTLVREEGLPFRVAHEIAAEVSAKVVAAGTSLSAGGYPVFLTAFEHAAGRPSSLDAEAFKRAVSAAEFIAVRSRHGGPAPAALADAFAVYREAIAGLSDRAESRTMQAKQAETMLEDAFAGLCAASSGKG